MQKRFQVTQLGIGILLLMLGVACGSNSNQVDEQATTEALVAESTQLTVDAADAATASAALEATAEAASEMATAGAEAVAAQATAEAQAMEAQATAEAAAAMVSTREAEEAAMAAATATAEASIPDTSSDFETTFSELNGITVMHPSDWLVQDDFGLFVGTDQAIIDDGPDAEAGAVMAFFAQPSDELGGSTPLEQLEELLDFFGADFLTGTPVEGPDATEIQGQPAATARFDTESENGDPLTVLAATIVNENNTVFALALAFEDANESYVETLELMLNSIVVSELSDDVLIDDPIIEEEREAAGDPIASTLGESYEITIPTNAYQDFTLENVGDQEILIQVVSPDDVSDAVFQIFDSSDLESPLREVDDLSLEKAFIFMPTGEESLTVRVYEFFSEEAEFTVSFSPVEVEQTMATLGQSYEGTLSDGTINEYVLEGLGGENIAIVASTTADIDLVIEIFEDNGAFSADRIDDTFAPDSEKTVFTPFDDAPIIVRVSDFNNSEGSFQISFEEAQIETTAVDIGQTVQGVVPAVAFSDYTIAAEEGVELRIFATTKDTNLDLVIEVYSEDDLSFWIDRSDNGFSGDSEELFFIPPDAGTYIIRVADFQEGGGEFELTVETFERETLALELGQTVSGEIPEGGFVSYEIDVAAGEAFDIVVSPATEGLDVLFEIYSSGLEFVDRIDAGFSDEAEELRFTPETDGTYTIRVFDFSDVGGAFELSTSTP